MARYRPFAAAQDNASTQDITQGLAYIKIEDDEDYKTPNVNLDELNDDQEGVDIIRELTPIDNQTTDELPFGCELLHFAKLNGETVQPGDSLEFNDGHFLHNIRIFHDHTKNQVTVDGNLLQRMSRLDTGPKGMLSTRRANELCCVLRALSTGKDPTLAECRRIRDLQDAVRKRLIILTNKAFPAHSIYEDPYLINNSRSMLEVRRDGQLVCRWRYTEETISSGKKSNTGSLMMLRENECDDNNSTRASDICLLNLFLKAKTPKQEPRTHDEKIRADEHEFIELLSDKDEEEVMVISKSDLKRPRDTTDDPIDLTADSDEDVQITKRKITDTIKRISSSGEYTVKRKLSSTIIEKGAQVSLKNAFSVRKQSRTNAPFAPQRAPPQAQRSSRPRRQKLDFTFGDLCTGGGGMASGAYQAGYRMNFLLDHWDVACTTLNLNFDRACKHILLNSIYDFCTRDWKVEYVDVDVLHISFPCQPHSPVHTVEGRNDMDNIATGYSVVPILRKSKPRIVTFEQTSGIVTHNGGVHFRAMIHQITDAGYSLRWKICNLAEYGNVQPRKRLIIIAACPGEILPPFPEPTHGVGPGKLPFVTVNDVLHRIRNIEVSDNMHYFTRKNVQPYDARKPLQHCITCDGATPHPTGKRTFTLFELAALQGFLPTHQFFGTATDIRKQIGNAVPSMFAKALFERIAQSLQESDLKIAAYQPEVVALADD
jgi:DNA (cytosine-5)-methyltransferase 1